jgi:hypothetical protein
MTSLILRIPGLTCRIVLLPNAGQMPILMSYAKMPVAVGKNYSEKA